MCSMGCDSVVTFSAFRVPRTLEPLKLEFVVVVANCSDQSVICISAQLKAKSFFAALRKKKRDHLDESC